MNAPAQFERRPGAVLYNRAAVAADTVSPESRSVDVVASTDTIDSHGTVLRQNWRLERYRSNPVVLYAHDSCELPIGTASNVRLEDGQLRATLTFSTAELNPLAEQVWLNVKAGVLRGISVGFWPHSVLFETHDDVEVLVFDDLELLEISVVPVGSNPETLAEMRSRALAVKRGADTAPPKPETIPVPTPEPQSNAAPRAQEDKKMSDNFTQSLIRALGLPLGATEADIIASATQAHECRTQVVAITGVATTAEAVGSVRGMAAAATEVTRLRTENDKIRGERDAQNFETQIQRGVSENKLTAPVVAQYRGLFEEAAAKGSGEDIVAQLKGFIDVAPTVRHVPVKQPATNRGHQGRGDASELVWNGRQYRDLRPMERAELAREAPELWGEMKNQWEASGRPGPTASTAA
jgi:HK97 family phage prohead protease